MVSSIPELSPEVKAAMARYLPFLEEIKRQLLFVAAVYALTAVLCGLYYNQILSFIIGHYDLKNINMVLTSPNQIFELAITTGLAGGLVPTIPLVIFFLLRFLRPALAPREFNLIVRMIPLSFVLFIMGFGFGVWVMQFVVALFTQAAGQLNVSNLWDVGKFLSQIVFSGFCLGILFQFPIVLTILIRLRVVKRSFFVAKRSVVYIAILAIAAALPPTDLISLVLLTIPLFLLFEITLLLNKTEPSAIAESKESEIANV